MRERPVTNPAPTPATFINAQNAITGLRGRDLLSTLRTVATVRRVDSKSRPRRPVIAFCALMNVAGVGAGFVTGLSRMSQHSFVKTSSRHANPEP